MARIRVTEDTIVSKKSNILSSNVDNEIVLLNILKGEYNGLNEVATQIWNVLELPICIKDIVIRLMKVYDVEKETCTSEIIDFVKELIGSGLVEVVNEQE